ncbi:sushi repeat-containing protein SRPX2 [Brienomyrus brachyistius]|uniref:sushi repeat-containing protein SRPX2 n=1 Tax=Brienomyrus brachyistius TaxID=42636 RepID=UPI0020B206AB|nr:sushi repeat-containing protein SRPX2 [Brienomyrus brachyistius]XP_048884743.1 sushi repeat-containing protein SRPX2 [Brienomyrus brachyistius]
MANLRLLLFLKVCALAEVSARNDGSGITEQYHHNEVTLEEEYDTPQLDYKDPRWCHPLSLRNGEVTCFSPRGGYYRSTLGTRCELTCDRGFRLLGRSSVQCMPNRRWSGTAHCRQVRCRVLPLIFHGTYSCTDSVLVNSRCSYICNPGYQLEGDHTRICLTEGQWSSREPTCADRDPPKIQCPLSRVRVAEQGELTAQVSWEAPVVKDTADVSAVEVILVGPNSGSHFEEGVHVIQYKAYDQARNKASCKFIVRVEVRRCPALVAPLHGRLTCSANGDNYGAECEYHCRAGYERQGPALRTCLSDRSWSGEVPLCVQLPIITTDARTAAALLDQFYLKRNLLIVSSPSSTDQYYGLQKLMLEKAECGLDMREVTVIELVGRAPNAVGYLKGRPLQPEVIRGFRQNLRISRTYFSMVLLDKRGVDRERLVDPTSSDELYSLIDMYLLNEEQRHQLDEYRDLCD